MAAESEQSSLNIEDGRDEEDATRSSRHCWVGIGILLNYRMILHVCVQWALLVMLMDVLGLFSDTIVRGDGGQTFGLAPCLVFAIVLPVAVIGYLGFPPASAFVPASQRPGTDAPNVTRCQHRLRCLPVWAVFVMIATAVDIILIRYLCKPFLSMAMEPHGKYVVQRTKGLNDRLQKLYVVLILDIAVRLFALLLVQLASPRFQRFLFRWKAERVERRRASMKYESFKVRDQDDDDLDGGADDRGGCTPGGGLRSRICCLWLRVSRHYGRLMQLIFLAMALWGLLDLIIPAIHRKEPNVCANALVRETVVDRYLRPYGDFCLLPYPSVELLEVDATSATGYRWSMGDRVYTRRGFAFAHAKARDGFSTFTPILFDARDVDNLASLPGNYYDTGALDEGPSMVVDTGVGPNCRGMPVRHFIYKQDDTVGSIQLLEPLAFDCRYVVGIRGLTRRGKFDTRSKPFREGAAHRGTDAALAVLAGAGWNASEVQLAWEFHTESLETSPLSDAMGMRNMALSQFNEALGVDALGVERCCGASFKHKVVSLEDYADACDLNGTGESRPSGMAYIQWGVFQAPTFPTDLSDSPRLGPTILSDVEYLLQVPCSALRNDPTDRPALVHVLHGYLNNRADALDLFFQKLAAENNYVLLSVDSVGFTEADFASLVQIAMSNVDRLQHVGSSLLQSQINRVLAQEALIASTQPLVSHTPRLRAALQGGFRSVGSYGNSLGGIMSLGHMALNGARLHRASISVGGAGFAFIIQNSRYFALFKWLLKWQTFLPSGKAGSGNAPGGRSSWFATNRKAIKGRLYGDVTVAMTQSFWDGFESGAWLQCFRNQTACAGLCVRGCDQSATFGNKTIMLQNAYADEGVTPIASHIIARAFDAKSILPLREIPAMRRGGEGGGDGDEEGEREEEGKGSFILEWLPGDRDLHNCVRWQPPSNVVAGAFLNARDVEGAAKAACGEEACVADMSIHNCPKAPHV